MVEKNEINFCPLCSQSTQNCYAAAHIDENGKKQDVHLKCALIEIISTEDPYQYPNLLGNLGNKIAQRLNL